MSFKSISHYQITGTLGQGGMGMVYKAIDQKLKRTVAIKTSPPERLNDENLRKRLMSEARAASTLNRWDSGLYVTRAAQCGRDRRTLKPS